MTGPAIAPSGKTEVNSPMARSRSDPKWSATIPDADGRIAPAATPCTARAAMSVAMLGASPQASDASVNTATAARKTRLRPNCSAMRPATGIAMIWPSA
jgi:hypothetical protein